jgi:hypothetical protein
VLPQHLYVLLYWLDWLHVDVSAVGFLFLDEDAVFRVRSGARLATATVGYVGSVSSVLVVGS